jgi:hypothetical protein
MVLNGAFRRGFMAYFLKKSYLKKGLYLQIYESFYDPIKKNTAHKSFKSLGYADNLITPDIPDPEAYYREVVNKMNQEAKRVKDEESNKQIGESPEKFIGYFPLQRIYQNLNVSNYLDLMQSVRKFRFRISDLIEALAYSRVIDPCSKLRTCHDILPKLYEFFKLSYDQILDGTEYIGTEYEKIIEIFNHQVNLKYTFNTSKTYFDCTNFYFEIDKEDDLRRKGPSKENKRDPIVGMGLLLDTNQIPMGMKMYPGNESEKPLIREVIKELKERNQISGRTVQVADKGLNCGDNVVEAVRNGDGYIFSKSVKQLPEIEQEWLLLKNGYKKVFDENGDLAYKIKSCIDEFSYDFTLENGTKKTVKLLQHRLRTLVPYIRFHFFS